MRTPTSVTIQQRTVLIGSMVALNLLFGAIVSALKLPLYLDSIGIVVSAIFLGVRSGALVGILTALVGTFFVTPFLWAYSLTGACIGISAGWLAKWGLFRRYWTVPIAGIAIGLVAALVSAPVTVLMFGGVTASGTNLITAFFLNIGYTLVQSVVYAGISSDVVDKLVVCLLAYTLCRSLPKRILGRFPDAMNRLGLETSSVQDPGAPSGPPGNLGPKS